MEEIKNYYKFMFENIPQFREFINENKNLSNDELLEKYNINTNKEQN